MTAKSPHASISTPRNPEQPVLEELRQQLTRQGTAIHQLVEEYAQGAKEHDRFEEARQKLSHGQKYLENLLDETAAEMDMLKRDVSAISAELSDLKQKMAQLLEQQPKFAVHVNDRIEVSSRSSSIPPAQRRILSSIPPRHLSEDEALELLEAVDRIVSGRRSVAPDPDAKSEH